MPLNVGEVSVSSKGVHWTIPNFSQLPQIHNTEIGSPSFHFENRRWLLWIYPNGRSVFSSLGWFGITAYAPFTPNECDIHLGIADEQGRSIVSSRAEWNGLFGNRCMKLISNAEFNSRKNEFMPDGTLNILFTIVNEETESTFHADINKVEDRKESKKKLNNELKDVSTQTEEEVGSKKPVDASKEVSTQTEEVGKKELKQNNDDVFKEIATQTEEEMGVWRLKQDFEKFLINGNVTDITLKTQNQEFRAHRCVLAARSPVFLAMMSHDTKEKNTGVIDIEDIDMHIIPDFLHYLYTGSVENLTSENALMLYSVADKYQLDELKQMCFKCLLTNISVENFCDVITLSLQYNEKDLKDACIDFFLEKSMEIVMTTNWQSFLTENPIIGNELFIKHLQLFKSILQETGKNVKQARDSIRS